MDFKKFEQHADQMSREVQDKNFRFDFLARLVVIWTLVSRIPLPQKWWPKCLVAGDRALALIPLAGAAMGLLAGLVTLAARMVGFSPLVAAWCGVGSYVKAGWILHLDGAADLWDGYGSGKTGEPLRAVMKDSHIGAYGTAGLVLVIGIWTSVLSEIETGMILPACIVAAGTGRFASCVAAYFGEYPWESGMGKGWVDTFSQYDLFTASVCVLILVIFSPVQWVSSVLAATAVGFLIAQYMNRRLGGVNGDVLGAAAVGAELCSLLVFAL